MINIVHDSGIPNLPAHGAIVLLSLINGPRRCHAAQAQDSRTTANRGTSFFPSDAQKRSNNWWKSGDPGEAPRATDQPGELSTLFAPHLRKYVYTAITKSTKKMIHREESLILVFLDMSRSWR